MRVCSACGERNEDWMDICQRCGNSIVNADVTDDYPTNNSYDDYGYGDYNDDNNESAKKSIENLDLKIILVILVIILIILSFIALT